MFLLGWALGILGYISVGGYLSYLEYVQAMVRYERFRLVTPSHRHYTQDPPRVDGSLVAFNALFWPILLVGQTIVGAVRWIGKRVGQRVRRRVELELAPERVRKELEGR